MRPYDAAVLGVCLGSLVGAAAFFVAARRACDRALAALAEARRDRAEIDERIDRQLDVLAKVEEFTA